MNSRERVVTALKRKSLPDRVPLQFDLSAQLLEAFSHRYKISAHYTHSYYEDLTYRISGNELRLAMGSDCVSVGGSLPRGYSHPVDGSGYITNEFGMKMRQGPIYMEVIDHPLAHAQTIGDVEAYQFPDPLAEGRYDDAAMYIEQYKGEYFIWGHIEVTLFPMMNHLVGMQKLMMDMALNEPYVELLRDKCLDFALAVGQKLVTLGVDGLLCGDDYGGQTSMLISPDMWRHYFKEQHRHLYGKLKELNPDLIIAQHSDGAVAPILSEWADVGVEVFNPVQPNVPGHEPEVLKRKLGHKLSFWGAIDQQELLPYGTPAEIEAEVKRRIDILGRDGGYLAAPAHILQADTPLENVEAFIQAVKKHGVYT